MAFCQLDQFLSPHAWSEQDWQVLQGNYFLCAASKEEPEDSLFAGGLLGTHPLRGDVGHLLKIVVHPNLRRRGAATLLLQFYLNHLRSIGARSLYLEVAVSNLDALKFYRKYGLKDLCVKKRFYQNGEDALSMELLLIS
ncbi:MAG: GNAT family N-acetyltransferase [Bdellovibrio sp.]|nr:GNAT family N-acetyltransferase [Bdellovibrio sp.]